jgi:hypothetical protein
MPAGATYTRTGAATALSSDGVVLSFAADAPPRTGRGLALGAAIPNLSLGSQDFGGVWWTKNASTVTDNAAAAPDGTTTADKLVEAATTAEHRFYSTIGSVVTVSTTHTWSVFVKAGERTVVQLRNNNLQGATFDLGAGGAASDVIGGTITTNAIALANGWFRISITGTALGAAERVTVNLVSGGSNSYAGDGTSGAFVWGAQLEAGPAASSYIPTGDVEVTRGLPIFTEPVPDGNTKALLTYADASTTLVTSLTPGDSFEYAEHVIAAGKGRFGVSELVTRRWTP